MSRIVLMPFGSAGDVFPFIWLGKMLQVRGHRVTVVSTRLFEEAVAAAGLDFVGLGTVDEVEAIGRDKRIWKLGIGTKVVLDYAVQWSERYLEAVGKLGELEKVDLLMAPLTAFGARMAREKYGIPLITVHLQPLVFVSAHDTPLFHPWLAWFRWVPVRLKRLLFSLPNPIDIFALPGIRMICRAHDIAPPSSLWREWWDSPDGVLALFPGWFAPPQPDWPGNLLQWDFPLEDLGTEVAMQPELESFLKHGEKPIIFTPGSANIQAERFFASALEAVKTLGIRAVFVTRMDLEIPSEMAGKVLLVDFVPFGKILSHAAVFVHHGGVGTLAQGFSAGVPQLIMAMAHDQPDNAARLEGLGAGIGLIPRTFTPERVSRELRKLLEEEKRREAAEQVREKMLGGSEKAELAHWIEHRLRNDRKKPGPQIAEISAQNTQ